MTTNIKDIHERIKTDFGTNADEAIKLLNNAILEKNYLKTPRIVRSLVFLSNGHLDKLAKYINSAISDPRDVMFLAEYENYESEKPKHVRDFNNDFENCERYVEE
jgi:hypothetical protein